MGKTKSIGIPLFLGRLGEPFPPKKGKGAAGQLNQCAFGKVVVFSSGKWNETHLT